VKSCTNFIVEAGSVVMIAMSTHKKRIELAIRFQAIRHHVAENHFNSRRVVQKYYVAIL
jgi:hypothetical protein